MMGKVRFIGNAIRVPGMRGLIAHASSTRRIEAKAGNDTDSITAFRKVMLCPAPLKITPAGRNLSNAPSRRKPVAAETANIRNAASVAVEIRRDTEEFY